jgi:hypothetical protein
MHRQRKIYLINLFFDHSNWQVDIFNLYELKNLESRYKYSWQRCIFWSFPLWSGQLSMKRGKTNIFWESHKIWKKISHLFLTLLSKCQNQVGFFSNFAAFSGHRRTNMSFIRAKVTRPGIKGTLYQLDRLIFLDS